ncbi:DUF3348 domain-containing protein [Noviherbaspirillum sedimenti]|uniref:DUF3348 domain-containing protein n=1 Tax=Noviherbaspirillum sedimenti TaxID=2320865 RepID=A0A3A3G2I0_9BURK|nr:DUF3348 domain-containing protein [Noviherbaspirillum sedimenti]RJG01029.1 DUF3348 domain-containing protein [Noviherbaspirillum sedimenti]
MARVLPRTNFHSSKLIRCLADMAMVDAVEPGNAFAEKLGLWVHFTDAIILSAVHNDSIAGLPKMHSEAQSAACVAVGVEFDRIRGSLVNAITKSCSPNLGKSHNELPVPQLALPMDLAAAVVPYRRFYEAHQRDMELRIHPLRVNVREALAKASPTLKKLADLDAAFEGILRERESKLLSTVPGLLKKRFEQLFKEHQQKLVDTQQADNPAGWMQAGGWLARFCNELQTLLLAEVELRLQPAMGLIEAITQDKQ